MARHIEKRMQSEHSVRNMSMQAVKENEKAGMVSTISAEKKCFNLQTQKDRIVVRCVFAASGNACVVLTAGLLFSEQFKLNGSCAKSILRSDHCLLHFWHLGEILENIFEGSLKHEESKLLSCLGPLRE